MRAGKRALTTGRGVAIGGPVLSVIALLLGIAAIVGVATTVSNNPQILDQITNLVNNARNQVPTP
jgi:predicted PurR-regulated permease PerM